MIVFQTQPDTDKPEKKKNARPSSSGMLYFIIGFIGCLIVIGIMGVIWWQVAKPDLSFLNGPQTTTTTAVQDNLPATRFAKDNRFSVAVYITDNEGNLQTTSLAMFKPDIDAIDVIGLPAEFGLPDADNDTLARRFATGDAEAAQMALSAYFGKNIDYYVVMSYQDVEAYFTALNEKLIITLPKDVDQQSADSSFSIHLTGGTAQSLSPKQTANLLICDNWQGGLRERADMHALVLNTYINQFISSSRSITADHSTLLSVAQSNLTGDRFTAIQPPLSYLAEENSGTISSTIAVEGHFAGAGDIKRFTLDDSIYETVKQALR